MSPQVFELNGHNNTLSSHTIALATGGTYKYRKPGAVFPSWSNLDYFTVSSSIMQLASDAWTDKQAETPKHSALLFDLRFVPLFARRIQRMVKLPPSPFTTLASHDLLDGMQPG